MVWGKFLGVFLLALGLQWGVLLLCRNYRIGQRIYALAPKTHQKKANTPSMGGVAMGVALLLGCVGLPWTGRMGWVVLVYMGFALLGVYDDVLSWYRQRNQGLTALQKCLGQCCLAVVLLSVYSFLGGNVTGWNWLVFTLALVGSSNATNLTDGVDGLLACTSMVTLLGFLGLAVQANRPDLLGVIAVLLLCVAGFYAVNRHPARMFMGDAGSLALGGVFAALAIDMGSVWLLLPLGAVYGIETLAVIIQVGWFKWQKKRVFLMTPLHHHFELLGFSERQIVAGFTALSVVLALLLFMG